MFQFRSLVWWKRFSVCFALLAIGIPGSAQAGKPGAGDEPTLLEKLVNAPAPANLRSETQSRLDAISKEFHLSITGYSTQEEADLFLRWFEVFKQSSRFDEMRFYIEETRKLSPQFRGRFHFQMKEGAPSFGWEAFVFGCRKERVKARKLVSTQGPSAVADLFAPAGLRPETIAYLKDVLGRGSDPWTAVFVSDGNTLTAEQVRERILDLFLLNDSQIPKLLDLESPPRWSWSKDSAGDTSMESIEVPLSDVLAGGFYFEARRRILVAKALAKCNLDYLRIDNALINRLSRADFQRFIEVVLPKAAKLPRVRDWGIETIHFEYNEYFREGFRPWEREFNVACPGIREIESVLDRLSRPAEMKLRVDYRRAVTLSLSDVSQEMKKQDAYAKSLLDEGFNLKLPSDPKDFEQARALFEAQRNSNQFKKAKFQIEETRKVYAEREANGQEPFNYWISVDYRGAGPGENFVFVSNLVSDRRLFDDHFREPTDSALDRFSRVNRSSFVDRGASKEVAEFLATEIEESGKHPIMSGVLLQIVDALVLSDNKILRSLNNGFYELPEARRKNYPVRLKIESEALVSITQLAYDPRLARNEMDVYPVLNRLVSTWGRIRANQAYKVSLDPELIVKLSREEYVRLNKEIIPRLQSLAVDKFDRKRIHLLYSEQGPKVGTDEPSNVINIGVKSLDELDPLIYP